MQWQRQDEGEAAAALALAHRLAAPSRTGQDLAEANRQLIRGQER